LPEAVGPITAMSVFIKSHFCVKKSAVNAFGKVKKNFS